MTILPGWIPPAAFTAARLGTLTQEDSATSTAQTITVPSAVQEGDLLVLLDRATGNGVTKAVPSGWTEINEGVYGTVIRQIASYRIADSDDAGSSVTGMNGATQNDKVMYAFRGDVPITSVNVSTPDSEVTDNNPSQQTVSASGGTAPLIVFGCYGSWGVIDPRTFTPAKDGEESSSTNLYLAYKIYSSSPQDVTIDMDDEGFFHILQSFYMECSA